MEKIERKFEISEVYKSKKFKELWKDRKETANNEEFGEKTRMLFTPFRCFALADFATKLTENDENLGKTYEKIRKECLKLKFYRKNNDLYSFKQSNDLLKIRQSLSENLREIVDFMKNDVKTWLETLLDTELSDRVTMTVSRYDYGDVLLCHDDELENRRIAYVFYLSENWSEQFGGRLDLFSVDEYNNPVKIAQSIIPAENMFLFFEVLPNSYHQVSEVVESGKRRLSINGWFHGNPQIRPAPTPEPAKLYVSPGFIEYDDVISWINPDYLNSDSQARIRQSFEDDSEIELRNFLQAKKYELVVEEFKLSELKWTNKTPYNERNFYSLNNIDERLTPNLHKCYRLMTSETFYLLLSQLTGLKLHNLFIEEDQEEECDKNDNNDKCSNGIGQNKSRDDPEIRATDQSDEEGAGPSCSKRPKIEAAESTDTINPKCEIEVRKFKHGCYTLMRDSYGDKNGGKIYENDKSDSKPSNSDFALDAQLFFTSNEWKVKHGGYTCYVAKGEDEELLTIVPKSNSLALVYRGGHDTMRFVKYVNSTASKENFEFLDFAAIYYER